MTCHAWLAGSHSYEAFVTGDFNGDRLSDLVMPNGADNTVRVRLGRGDGTFMPDARSPSRRCRAPGSW